MGCNTTSGKSIAATNDLIGTEILISPYDKMLQEAAQKAGYDWRMLSAIAHTESNFQPNAKSPVGAIGLMQIMPNTARNFGVEATEAVDPMVNIDLAVKVLKTIEQTLRFGAAPEDEKLRIMLAGYNAGIGSLIESRKIAVSNGVNHNNWEQLKNYGAVNNPETKKFVEKVIAKYNHYKSIY